MLDQINFQDYAKSKSEHYKRLSDFKIDSKNLGKPIDLDIDFFKKISENFKQVLQRRVENKRFKHAENREYKELLKHLFPELLPIFEHKGCAVYWFTITRKSGITNKEILDHYSEVKKNTSGWWTKLDSKRLYETDILYLGKVEGQFQNRFIQHIGLGHDYTTALKLQHWLPSTPKEFSVIFNYITIPNEMKNYLEDIENVMWRHAKPLLGASPRISY